VPVSRSTGTWRRFGSALIVSHTRSRSCPA
jgi:hypothetical protein